MLIKRVTDPKPGFARFLCTGGGLSIPSSDREPSRSLSVQSLRDADERNLLEFFKTNLKTLILEEQKHVSHDGFF